MRGSATNENIFLNKKEKEKKQNPFDLPFEHFATMIIHYFNIKYCFCAETYKYNVPLFGNGIAILYFLI